MGQEPEAASNSSDRKKTSKIFTAAGYGILSMVVGASGYVGKVMHDTYDANLREVESKNGTPAQPSELAAEALKKRTVFAQAVAEAFENNTPLVIDLTDPALRQRLEEAVQETRAIKKRFNEGGKVMLEFGAAGLGVLAVSMIGYNVYKRRKAQQADNSPGPGNG